VYGEKGRGFAHVHHVEPLGHRGKSRITHLKDLKIVCANCHAVIHRYGECLELRGLIA
jgi:predicted HNH restriction endonuclease